MANRLFENYRNILVGGGTNPGMVDWDANTIKVHLIDTADHDPNTTTDDTESDIVNAAIVATATLASVTVGVVGVGVVDAADTTLTSVSGDQCEELVLWKDSGVDTTSPLLVCFDTFGSGMPVTPNGGNIVINWNASGIWGL